jgi:hypothetical protein
MVPFRHWSGKNGEISAPICGFFGQKGLKNG